MLGVCCGTEILLMAAGTLRWGSLVLAVGVTLRAWDVRMLPGQLEIGLVMVKCRRLPRRSGMTGLALRREGGRRVLRVRRSIVLLLMARDALRGESLKPVARMALRAGGRQVSTSQCKSGRGMVKSSTPLHRGDCVAIRTFGPDARYAMGWGTRGIIISTVTPVAGGRRIDVFVFHLIDVTCLACRRLMWTNQGKTCLGVPLEHIRHQP
jgi:hypothetical protein